MTLSADGRYNKSALEIQSIYHLLHFSVKDTMNGGSADIHLCSLNPSFRSDETYQAYVCEAKTSKGILNCLICLWLTQMEKQFTSEITLAVLGRKNEKKNKKQHQFDNLGETSSVALSVWVSLKYTKGDRIGKSH